MSQPNRRTFLKATGGASLALLGSERVAAHRASVAAGAQQKWYQDAWRRAVIDMHIPDWDERFLSEFNPREYAANLAKSRAQSIVCYCQSHVGLFNYPTEVGRQHAAFAERNVLQEMIEACHERDIAVVLYCSLIFDRDAGDQFPEWRMRTWDGRVQGDGGRHAVLCVNSPYRDYVSRFVEEICGTFDFEGIRFDMTFWPWLCYCDHCRRRFDEEVGGELPTTVDWFDEAWVAFQRCRERWLVEFATIATSAVRRLKPEATVEHQSSTYPLNWMFGVSEPLAAQNDFLQGDFYGDQLQGSFVRKLLERLTPQRPFGYETSFSVALNDHTAMKSAELLEAKASAAIADHAAFVFIDAIDPVGTVNHRAHERMGEVFERLMPCYVQLGGERVEDVGIYYSLESKFNMNGNGRHVGSPDTSDSHTESAMQVAARLIRSHLPFGVLTRRTLDQLDRFQVLVLSNVHMMDPESCRIIRDWVARGGRLLATGGSSLVTSSGRRQDDFLLADVLGVSLETANWSDVPHYLAPTDEGRGLFPEFNVQYPAFCQGPGFTVRAHPSTTVLATTTLPWPAEDGSRFASIHSNPPWIRTDRPEITLNRFGDGAAIYCASLVEELDVAETALVNLIRRMQPRFSFEVDAPGSVEATLFRQADRDRHLLSLVSFQKELPNIPIDGVRVRLHLDETIASIVHLESERTVDFQRDLDTVEFEAPRLETLAQFELRWS